MSLDVDRTCEWGVKVDGDIEEVEEAGNVAAAWTAASFSNFLMRANCWRSDIGVWHGTLDMTFVENPTDVGDDPALLR